MPCVYSKRKGAEPPPVDAEYVGRPTRWGNPFVVGVHGGQGECVELFREWIGRPEQRSLRQAARRMLRGKDLVCWCSSPNKPRPCHANVWIEIANEEADGL